MKLRATITFMTLLLVTHVSGQTRTLTGKVIDNEFNPLAQVSIFKADTILLAKTDKNGEFSISVPADTKALIVVDVGREWKSLDLLSDCNNLEIILQLAATYDFLSPAKVDRLRKKEFDKLPGLHQAAFAKGIFKTDKPCYIDKFISHSKEMIKRHNARTQQPST